jgi:hypothetical protein
LAVDAQRSGSRYLDVIDDFGSWRRELLLTGNIVQADDLTTDRNEAVARQWRYIELLELVDGSEGQEVFQTLLDSMQAEEDYEVYESTRRVLGRFTGDRFGRWFFDALPEFVRRRGEDDVDDFLSAIAAGNLGPDAIIAFNDAWASADPAWRDYLLELVLRLEHRGSLSIQGRSGKLRPA